MNKLQSSLIEIEQKLREVYAKADLESNRKSDIDIENINSTYENGVLNIVLPKSVKEDKSKIIEIQ